MAPGPSFSIDYNNVYLLLIIICSLIRFHIFIHYTIHLIALFSADREDWQPSYRWVQSNHLSLCRSTLVDGYAPEIIDVHLVVAFKVLLVRLNLGSSQWENCYLLHPHHRLGQHQPYHHKPSCARCIIRKLTTKNSKIVPTFQHTHCMQSQTKQVFLKQIH